MSKWIPVTERLPDTHPVEDFFLLSDPVLVTGRREHEDEDDPPVLIGTYEDDLDGNTYWNTFGCDLLFDVTAWMPLPEPYKEGE